MPPPPKKTDSSRDLDRDGDIDLADNALNDLNRDGRIDANDREENDLDNDQDIDAADHALKAGLGEQAQSVGAALGFSKSDQSWSKPGQNVQQPAPGPKIGKV